MATLAPSSADAKSQFEQHYLTVRAMIWRKCRSDECRQNALAWSWYWFLRYRHKGARRAAIAAAMYGVKLCRRTFGRPPRRGYVDALNRTESAPDLDPATCERQNAVELNWRIDDMPVGIRIVALPLSCGLNRTETAALIGVSTETVRQRCHDIAEWIAARK